MSGLILPGRFKSQPQYNAPLNRKLAKGLKILFNPALGPVDLITGRKWAPSGDAAIKNSAHGRVFNLDGVDDYYSFTGYPELTSNVGTFFIWCPRVGAPDTNGHVLFGASSPNISGHQIYPTLAVSIGSNSPSSGALPSWFDTRNRSLVLVSGGTGATCKAYLDGRDTGLTWSDSPVAWGAGNKNFNFGRYVGGNSWDTDASVRIAGLSSALWGPKEAREFHESGGLSLFKAPSRQLRLVSSAATLIGSNLTEANVGGSGAVTQGQAIAGATANQANHAGANAITQAHVLSTSGGLQANEGSSAAATQGANLTALNGGQVNVLDADSISQAHLLAVLNLDQVNAAASVVITQGFVSNLAIANAAQGNLIDAYAITQAHMLNSLTSNQANLALAVVISQGAVTNLMAANLLQGNLFPGNVVIQGHKLNIGNASQSNLAASLQINKGVDLIIGSGLQANLAQSGIASLVKILAGSNVVQFNELPTSIIMAFEPEITMLTAGSLIQLNLLSPGAIALAAPDLTIYQKLFATLNSLVTGGAHAEVIPQSHKLFPALRYTFPTINTMGGICGDSDMDNFRIQIDVYSKEFDPLATIKRQIVTAMRDNFEHAERTNGFTSYEDNVKMYRLMLEYSVYYDS